MSTVVNTAASVPMKFLDATNTGKTGLTVVATARLAGTTTTVAGTVTERTGGEYDAAITFPTVGTWLFQGNTTVDGDPALWPETIQVVTAAKDDPAAAITALYGALLANLDAAVSTRLAAASAAAPLAHLDADVSSRASAADYTSARAAKLDQLDAAISSRTTPGSVAALLGNLDAAVSSRATPATITALQAALSGMGVTVVSPVAQSGAVTIYRGDDYLSADARALVWTLTGAPSLVAAIVVTLTIAVDTATLVAAGSVSGAGTGSQVVSVGLTHTQTATLPASANGTYDLSATLANGHVVTLARGPVAVTKDLP